MTNTTYRRISGFTLLEMLIAIAILSIVMTMTMTAFSSVSRAWKKGNRLSTTSSHAEFLMEQLVSGLRSSYFPDSSRHGGLYGFWLDDDGDGSSAQDTMSWVKMGYDLTTADNQEVRGPHRIFFQMDRIPGEYEEGIGVKVWQVYGKDEDFDYEDLETSILSDYVVGFNCRVSTNLTEDGWEWLDEWEDEQTNMLPAAVELTLYMKPAEKLDRPIEVKRLVEIPVAHLSWSGRTQRPTSRQRPGAARDARGQPTPVAGGVRGDAPSSTPRGRNRSRASTDRRGNRSGRSTERNESRRPSVPPSNFVRPSTPTFPPIPGKR